MKTPAHRAHATLPGALKTVTTALLLSLASQAANAEELADTPLQPPDILLGPLFNDVQSAKLFPDQKTFADAVPKSDPLTILADYRMQHTQSGFDLRHFVEMLRELDIPMVAEGIETEAHYRLATELGVQFAQGFWLGMPLDAATVLDKIEHEGLSVGPTGR